MFSSGCPKVRCGPISDRLPSPTTWHPWHPIDLTICSPLFASPRGGFLTAGSYVVSVFANRYATMPLISASLLAASSGELLFELEKKRGIQVVGFTARGFRIQFFTQSAVNLDPIRVRMGPGLRMLVSKPLVLWHA